MECLTCGGTDFYKEHGYFYCSECQVQSQEVVEHVFQEETTYVNAKNTKKIKHSKSEKADQKITSWECYNNVMYSLTQQLIRLGADKNLKPVVKYLWMRYLEKLEIFDLKYDAPPKLPVVNCKRDADILYEVPKKKRKRKSPLSDAGSMTFDKVSLTRERSKKKRALAEAHYESFSQKSVQDDTLHSETLGSLKSSSEKSVKQGGPKSFNRYSIKELRKKMSKGHCRRHKFDKSQMMKCHKLTYKNCSREYYEGVYFLSPIKMYCILYLGLLINRDKIQLGDLFRFMREGHINFNNYTELLPEDYSNKFINIRNNNKNSLFSSSLFRTTTAKMAKFLNVVRYIKVINILDLCQRFCKEMNLPGEILASVENLISKTNPKLTFTNKDTIIPNYEGRAMSMIIFTLKLLFGLDGETELELSKYAQLVNSVETDKPQMFDIVKWMTHISYRDLIMSEHHFPTSYSKNPNEINSDLFLQYVMSKNITPDKTIKFTKEMNSYKELLLKLQEFGDNSDTSLELQPSSMPFSEYTNILSNTIKYDTENILKQNFQEHSLDFLLRPNRYLHLVSKTVKVKHGGANDNWVIENIKSYRSEMLSTRPDHNLIPIEIIEKGSEQGLNKTCLKQNLPNIKHDPQHIQKNYEECRQHIFHNNSLYLEKISGKVQFNKNNAVRISPYNNHFNPYERYWLHLQMNVNYLNRKINEEFFNKHPAAFKLVFKECARIIEQTFEELLYDYQFCELFLVYGASYKDKHDKSGEKKLLDISLQHYIAQAKAYW